MNSPIPPSCHKMTYTRPVYLATATYVKDRMEHHYMIEQELGKGTFGAVYLGRGYTDGRQYAIKRIIKNNSDASQIMKVRNEIRAGQLLDHKNIAKFHRFFEDETSYYLIFDYLAGCDLFTFLERKGFRAFSESEARDIMQQLVGALQYMHQRGVVHVDVKLDNIMIDPTTMTVKFIDFGLCQFITAEAGDLFYGASGSDHYFPAEMMELGHFGRYHGIKIDVWCLGVVLHALLTTSFPFNIKERNRAILANGKHPVLANTFPMSDAARDLICRMLANQPEYRLSMDDVSKHPWMQRQHIFLQQSI